MSVQADLHGLSEALAPVEVAARSLPWSAQDPWRCTSHLGVSGGRPLIDLHGLSVRLALQVVACVVDTPVRTGAVVLITGRGNHTGGRSKLRDAVLNDLRERGLPFSPRGPGRVEVILDAGRARRSSPGLGLLFWLMVALLILAVIATIVNRLP